MRILYVITQADIIGGAQVHIRDLTQRLKADGHEPHVAAGGEGKFSDAIRANGVQFHNLKHMIREISPFRDFQGILELRRLIKKLKPDLISAHSSKAGTIARIAAIGTGKPIIFTAHGWAFTDGVGERRATFYSLIEKTLAPLTSKIITVSDYDRDLALKRKVASPSKVITVHNGMPGKVRLKNPEDFNNGPVRLIMVARFQPPKNHELLLRGLANVSQNLNWTLDLVGGGELQDKARETASALGISKRVSFLGERTDIAELLGKSDIFLLISGWEGFPRSILEAMREGLPVIASNVGGVSESVIHNQNGLLVTAGSEEELVAALENLIGDAELRSRFGAVGGKRFREHFTFDIMYRNTISIYENLLLKHHH